MYFKKLVVEPSPASLPVPRRTPPPPRTPSPRPPSPLPRSRSHDDDERPGGDGPERHILVGIDSSPASIDALEFVFEHIVRPPPPGARPDHLTCLCVLREPLLSLDDIAAGKTLRDLQRAVEKRFVAGLKRLLTSLRDGKRQRARMTIKLAWADEPRSAIDEIARALRPDLLVLGTRGLTGSVGGAFLGSCSGYLLHRCPAETVVCRTSTRESLRREEERCRVVGYEHAAEVLAGAGEAADKLAVGGDWEMALDGSRDGSGATASPATARTASPATPAGQPTPPGQLLVPLAVEGGAEAPRQARPRRSSFIGSLFGRA